MIKHLNLVWFESRENTQECGINTHTLLKVELESESYTLKGKLKDWTVLRVLSACLIKSDVLAKPVGSNLRVSWKSIWKLYEVFTTYIHFSTKRQIESISIKNMSIYCSLLKMKPTLIFLLLLLLPLYLDVYQCQHVHHRKLNKVPQRRQKNRSPISLSQPNFDGKSQIWYEEAN